MRTIFSIAVLFSVFVFTGCKRDEVKVYHVQKESQPQLKFILPDGWQEIAPSQMRVASFIVTNANGQTADVGVIPLPTGENELALVNMWREQMQLPALTNEMAAENISVGSDSAKLFEIASEQPLINGKFRARILVADSSRGATSWFFKMTGEDSFVASQKENFLNFLKSVSFNENSAPQISAAPETQTENSIWTIPSDWKSVPPSSSVLLAQFLIQNGDAQAEVNVAEFSGEAGGLTANVNRWRGQIGLPQISEADLQPQITSMDSSNGKIQIVDFVGTDSKTKKPARLVGAVVPQNGQTWFYKLMGDPQLVAQQKDAFLKFIQSAKYP